MQYAAKPQNQPAAPASLLMLDQTPVVAGVGTIPGFVGLAAVAIIAARLHRPQWPRLMQWLLAAVWYSAYLAADTLHTVGHIRLARQSGAPMDRVVPSWGLFATVYDNREVPARQHLGQAAGGILASGAATALSFPFYALLRRIPLLGAGIEAWFMCNALILLGAAAPTPHFDGAALLKWFVTQRTGEEALGDEAVQTAGSALIAGLGVLALILLLRRQWRWSGAALLSATIAALDLYVFKGKLPL